MKTIPYVTLFLSLRNRFHKSILIKAFSLCNRNLFFHKKMLKEHPFDYEMR